VTLADLRRIREEPGLDPGCDWDENCFCRDNPNTEKCRHYELLPRCFLPALQTLFEPPQGDSNLLWVTLMLYDENAGRYVFRTLSQFTRGTEDFNVFLLLYRVAEVSYGEGGGKLFGEWIVDFSDVMRRLERGKEVDYCLPLETCPTRATAAQTPDQKSLEGDTLGESKRKAEPVTVIEEASPIVKHEAVKEKAEGLRAALKEVAAKNPSMLDDLARIIVDPRSKVEVASSEIAERIRKFMDEKVVETVKEYLFNPSCYL